MRVVLVLLAACGATPSSPTTTPEPPPRGVAPPAPDAAPVVIVPPGCANQEACHHEAEDHEADGDFAAAALAYGRACELGDGASCFARGVLLRGRIEPRDDKGSHEAFGKACEQKLADGCAQYATDLLTGVGVAANADAGRAVLQRACIDGAGLACHNLGVIARDGAFGATKDPAGAYSLFEDGCRLGRGASCVEQAIALHAGTGIPRDAKRAVELADQACGSSAEHCWFRAELYQKEKKFTQARPLHDKACGAGSAIACHNLGVMLAKGLGGKKDTKRSFDAFERACSLGIRDDC
ncbi:MAG: tetratricopeptide repeat protein [Kofleriaceae bacterium]